MKIRLFFIVLLFLSHSFAGGFRFPNQPYKTAKLFLFNTHYKKGRPDLYIFKNGVYAKSKIGNGKNLNQNFIDKLNHIFSHGIEEIWMGLSKCTIPRHGIIFYNKNGGPIASISVCFQCQQVNFWSSVPLHSNPDYENMDIDKAEKQIKGIKTLFKDNDIPVYEDVKEYASYVDLNPNYQAQRELEMKNFELDSLFSKKIIYSDFKKWGVGNIALKRDTIEKRTMSDIYYFYEYTTYDKTDHTHFIVSDVNDDAYLLEAEIYSPNVKLSNGIQVGMSHQDVMNIISPVLQGLIDYKTITVSGKKYKLEYSFKNQTLVKIVLYIWPN